MLEEKEKQKIIEKTLEKLPLSNDNEDIIEQIFRVKRERLGA